VIINVEPETLAAGDTWSWTREFSEYPAPTWTLAYYFRNATQKFAIAGGEIVASGNQFVVTKAAADTASLVAGRYSWQALVSNGALRHKAAEGVLIVEPNYATDVVLDTRSQARKLLDAIDATLNGRATVDQKSMSVAGRTIERMTAAELWQLRQRVAMDVKREEDAALLADGGPDRRRVGIRFGRA